MKEKDVEFVFKARYFTSGTMDAATRQVWIVLHGYSQLAKYFIKKFKSLNDLNICVIAPEGLSHFYLAELIEQGRRDNKVGATWMTSENRLMDIDNYILYLDSIYEKELKGFAHLPVTLLGFSQGCATACRWATHGKFKFEKLVLWAGLFPPDMNFQIGHDILTSKKTYMVVGDQDPLMTADRMNDFDELALKLGIQPEKIVFKGKHEINEGVFSQLM